LNPTGTALIYSTYLGGSANAIAVDATGNAYITGTDGNVAVTTPGAFQTSPVDGKDAFVTKLNPAGTALVYSTFLGTGRTDDHGTNRVANGVAVDATGNAYVTGTTDADSVFPTTPGVIQPAFVGNGNDSFVARISPAPPLCDVAAMLPGPPTQLQVVVHADRGLSNLVVSSATNATVALPPFAPGATDVPLVTATKLDQTQTASVTLRAIDQSGASTSCNLALITVGRGSGESFVQELQGDRDVTVLNGTPGVNRVRPQVNGHDFHVTNLQAGERRTVDVSSVMQNGTDNSVLVVALGPRGSSVVVLTVGDSQD
jgi:hypothetical protein